MADYQSAFDDLLHSADHGVFLPTPALRGRGVAVEGGLLGGWRAEDLAEALAKRRMAPSFPWGAGGDHCPRTVYVGAVAAC